MKNSERSEMKLWCPILGSFSVFASRDQVKPRIFSSVMTISKVDSNRIPTEYESDALPL
jgi:hypothetical protein